MAFMGKGIGHDRGLCIGWRHSASGVIDSNLTVFEVRRRTE
jgi:hypothetical protein